MRTKPFFTMALAGLMMASLTTTAGAKEVHVDNTIASISASKTVPVTWKNFVRAESDKMFASVVS